MILVNGEARSTVNVTDRGLSYGDGVFRTFPARRGHPLHWGRQYAKLAHDCAALALRVPHAPELEQDIAKACDSRAACAVKVIVTRCEAPRGYAYSPECAVTRIVSADAAPEYPARYSEDGVRVRLCSLRLAMQPLLAGVKHLNRLENVLARAEWNDSDVAEGLLCDTNANVIGGTMTNVFILLRGELLTPRLDYCGVAGVTRDRVIEAAAREGVPCRIAAFGWDALLAAEEVFLVNSLTGVWPVRELAHHARVPGAITRRLQHALAEEDDAQAH